MTRHGLKKSEIRKDLVSLLQVIGSSDCSHWNSFFGGSKLELIIVTINDYDYNRNRDYLHDD